MDNFDDGTRGFGQSQTVFQNAGLDGMLSAALALPQPKMPQAADIRLLALSTFVGSVALCAGLVELARRLRGGFWARWLIVAGFAYGCLGINNTIEAARLEPSDWNGETMNIGLVDIYREGTANLYRSRPKVDVPLQMSGMGSHEIKPGGTLTVKTDARTWELQGGWSPGHYKITIRVDHLTVDRYSTLSVMSDPVEFRVE